MSPGINDFWFVSHGVYCGLVWRHLVCFDIFEEKNWHCEDWSNFSSRYMFRLSQADCIFAFALLMCNHFVSL